jgi:hypothetical protein
MLVPAWKASRWLLLTEEGHLLDHNKPGLHDCIALVANFMLLRADQVIERRLTLTRQQLIQRCDADVDDLFHHRRRHSAQPRMVFQLR